MSNLPELISSKSIYEGFFDFQEDILLHPNGQTYSLHTLLTKAEAVAVLPILSPEKYLLTFEYRHPVRQKMLSCPGGRMDEGEDPIVSGKREMLEETGYVAKKWTYLGLSYPFPSICDQKVHLVLAEELEKIADPTLEPMETIDLHPIDRYSLDRYIQSGGPIDNVVLALFSFYNLRKKLV